MYKRQYEEGAPVCDSKILELGVPILGICYGSQLLSLKLGGNVASAPAGEYGNTQIKYCLLYTSSKKKGKKKVKKQRAKMFA